MEVATTAPLPETRFLGEALTIRIETLSRVKKREENGEFDYVSEDLSNVLSFKDFIDLCVLKTPQNKGWLLEDFICRKFGWKHLPPWKHSGDGYDLVGKRSYEIKSSFSGNNILLKQVRLFQKIGRYIYVRVDELEPENTEVFILDHEQMAREVKEHGKKSSKGRSRRGGNQYDIEIEAGTPEYESWRRHYLDNFVKGRLLSD